MTDLPAATKERRHQARRGLPAWMWVTERVWAGVSPSEAKVLGWSGRTVVCTRFAPVP